LLYVNRRDLRQLPLEQRKEQLHALLAGSPLRYSEHFDVDGPTRALEQYTVLNVRTRLSARPDPWLDYWTAKQRLPSIRKV
jgi:hypothetical protein